MAIFGNVLGSVVTAGLFLTFAVVMFTLIWYYGKVQRKKSEQRSTSASARHYPGSFFWRLWRPRQPVTPIIIALAILLCVGIWYLIGPWPAERQSVRDILKADPAQVVSVEVIPSSSTLWTNPVNARIEVTDPLAIKELCAVLRTAKPYEPNHPSTQWLCYIGIKTRDTSCELGVYGTRSQGVLFHLSSANGWIVGQFRCNGLEDWLRNLPATSP